MSAETWGWSVTPMKDGRNFITNSEYRHAFDIAPLDLPEDVPERAKRLAGKFYGRYEIWVPEGFVFDGSSTPRCYWHIAPPMTGKHTHASLLHDMLYTEKKIWSMTNGGVDGEKINRVLADLCFLVVMLQDGVDTQQATDMWQAVELFGSKAWKDKK